MKVQRIFKILLPCAIATVAGAAQSEENFLHAELDPLTFIQRGYGGQIGIRIPHHTQWRVALASFSLNVPDFIAQMNGNQGFHIRVLPSIAVYALWYLNPEIRGWAFGGSFRYLRFRYTHDAFPGATTEDDQLSLEAIVGYKYHPFQESGFYLQPFLGLSHSLSHSGAGTIGTRTYQEPVLSVFSTVNLGWEFPL